MKKINKTVAIGSTIALATTLVLAQALEVHADEVDNTTTETATTTSIDGTTTETVTTTTLVESEALDTVVAAAENAGVTVTTGETQTFSSVTEAEADYVKQVENVTATTSQYQTDLAEYESKVAKLNENKISEDTSADMILSGTFDEAATGVDYVSNVTATYIGSDTTVKTAELGWGSNTTISDVTNGTLSDYISIVNNITVVSQVTPVYTISDVVEGTTFKLNSIGTTADGTNINAKVTVLSAEKDNTGSSYIAIGYQSSTGTYAPIGFNYLNLSKIQLKYEFVDDDGNPLKLALAFVVADVDFLQTSKISFSDSSVNYYNFTNSGLVETEDGLIGSESFAADSFSSVPLGSYLAYGLGSSLTYTHISDVNAYTGSRTNTSNYIEFLLFGSGASVATETLIKPTASVEVHKNQVVETTTIVTPPAPQTEEPSVEPSVAPAPQKRELPQTGESTTGLSVLGAGLLGVLAFFGLKRKEVK